MHQSKSIDEKTTEIAVTSPKNVSENENESNSIVFLFKCLQQRFNLQRLQSRENFQGKHILTEGNGVNILPVLSKQSQNSDATEFENRSDSRDRASRKRKPSRSSSSSIQLDYSSMFKVLKQRFHLRKYASGYQATTRKTEDSLRSLLSSMPLLNLEDSRLPAVSENRFNMLSVGEELSPENPNFNASDMASTSHQSYLRVPHNTDQVSPSSAPSLPQKSQPGDSANLSSTRGHRPALPSVSRQLDVNRTTSQSSYHLPSYYNLQHLYKKNGFISENHRSIQYKQFPAVSRTPFHHNVNHQSSTYVGNSYQPRSSNDRQPLPSFNIVSFNPQPKTDEVKLFPLTGEPQTKRRRRRWIPQELFAEYDVPEFSNEKQANSYRRKRLSNEGKRIVCSIPRNGANSVIVSFDDLARLKPGHHLNDPIVDFYLKWIFSTSAKDVQECCHLFSSYFFFAIRQMQDATSKEIYLKAKGWTAGLSLFEKHFLFIPIRCLQHWTLMVVCNLPKIGELLCERKAKTELKFAWLDKDFYYCQTTSLYYIFPFQACS